MQMIIATIWVFCFKLMIAPKRLSRVVIERGRPALTARILFPCPPAKMRGADGTHGTSAQIDQLRRNDGERPTAFHLPRLPPNLGQINGC